MSRIAQEDRALVRAFLATRDEGAFRALYRRHTPALWALALRMTGGREPEAEEVLQETWIRAVRGLSGFRWRSALRTWLSGIAINCFRERLRRRKREPTPVGADPAELFSGGGGETSRDSTGERIDLERAIARLPDGYREVFVLHDLQGYTHQEIAGLLEIHTGTSKSQLSRARRALRALLTPDTSQSEEEDRDER